MRIVATCRWAAAIALVFALGTPHALGGTGTPFTLPAGSLPFAQNGLKLGISCDWVQGYGQRPIRLDLTSATRVNFDRSLRIEVGLGNWGESRYVIVSTDVELPAGSLVVSKSVPVPQLASTVLMSVRTLEGGREVEELSVKQQSINTGQFWGGDTGIPRMLFVRDAPPDVSSFSFLGTTPYMSYGNAINFSQLKDVFAFVHLTPDRLYDQWLYYSGLDMMFISLAEARNLSNQRPAAWRAIADWTRTGGTLCVFGMGREPAQLEEVEKLLAASTDEKRASLANRGWESPTDEVFETHVLKALVDVAAAAVAQAQLDGSTPPAAPALPKKPSEPPFLWRDVAFGQLVSLPADNPFPGDAAQWQWLLASLDPSSTRWTSRNGTAPDAGNPQFNDLLIADVGLPPIRTYRVLITLFVVLIGPVNYWLLRRSGRLYLFLFTVPLAALLTSLGLLGYALMSDGLVSRLRARSLTVLDQRAGEATSRARLSYYVGLTPSNGLMFPQDTLVTPLELVPTTSGNGRNRYADWNDQQHLTRGWLSARTPTQLTTARANHSEIGIDVSASDKGARQVHNRLGVRIQHLLVFDEDGGWHQAADVGAGERMALEALSAELLRNTAATRFGKLLSAHAPAPPEGMDFSGNDQWLWFGRAYTNYQSSGVDPTGSRLERNLDRLRAEILQHVLAPRSYVAIVDHPAEVITGLEGLTETQSLHVIQGTW
jgi:hypothetical protein